MGRDIALDTAHGTVCAWRADPVAQPRGALVVVQEVFGVNDHIRSVVERYAAEGWIALAPELFDPIETGVELGYDQAGVAKGRELAAALGFDRAIAIVDAAARRLQTEGCKVGVVGFCWGGTIALLANCCIPDDCIDPKRYPLCMAREVMRRVIERIKAKASGSTIS